MTITAKQKLPQEFRTLKGPIYKHTISDVAQWCIVFQGQVIGPFEDKDEAYRYQDYENARLGFNRSEAEMEEAWSVATLMKMIPFMHPID